MTDEGLGQTDEDGVVAFVLDGMPAAEREAFELQLENDGEMRRLVTEYRNCLGELSLSAPQEDPPPDMLQKIRARIDDAEMAWQREPQNRERRPILWVGWAVAAGFAVAVDSGTGAVLLFPSAVMGGVHPRRIARTRAGMLNLESFCRWTMIREPPGMDWGWQEEELQRPSIVCVRISKRSKSRWGS